METLDHAVAVPAAAPVSGVRRYRLLLGSPGVAPVVIAGMIARVPLGMMALAIVLLVRDAGRSYAVAGAVVAANTIATALAGPVVGRLIDRLGQRRVLVPLAILFPAGMVLLAILAPAGAPTWALIVAAFGTGAVFPPVGACMRALWGDLIPAPDLRTTAYALEASLQEVFFVIGPLITAVLAALASPQAALVVAAGFALVGGQAFAATTASRRQRGTRRTGGSRLGALASPGVRTVLLAYVAMGAAFGTIEVAMPAFAEAHGSRAAGGIPLATFSLGSLLGGLWVGARVTGVRPATGWLVASAALAAALVPPIFAGSVAVMALLLLVTGFPIAPSFASSYGLVNELSAPGTETEAFAWLTTAIVTGVSIGTAVGGDIIHRADAPAALIFAAACGALASAVGLLRRRTLLSPPPTA